MIYHGISGKVYDIPDDPRSALAVGGEGSIYNIDSQHVAKIYLKKVLSEDKDLESKIRSMISKSPGRIMKYMAWPTDALYQNGVFVGFVMNKLSGYSQLRELYSFSIAESPSVDLRLLVALNLSSMVNEIHNAGYVIGDFNPKNIGYNKNGTVCFYDNDSFQFRGDNGHLFRCNVNFEGYVAPEVMDETEDLKRRLIREGKDPSKVQMKDLEVGFTVDTDNFALAVHIFQLFFNGFNPYASVLSGERRAGDSPRMSNASSSRIVPMAEENVRLDNYCFKVGRQPKSAAVPRMDLFPPYIAKLFLESFRHIRQNEHRPSAQDWVRALQQYRGEVRCCAKQKDHIFWKGSSICPYCDAVERFSYAAKQYKTVVSTSSGSRPKVGFMKNATVDELSQFMKYKSARTNIKSITNGSSLQDVLYLDTQIVGLLSRYLLEPSEERALHSCQDEISKIKSVINSPIEVEINLPVNNLEDGSQKIIVHCPTNGYSGEYSFGDICHLKLPRTTNGKVSDQISCSISVEYYRKNEYFRYKCDTTFQLQLDYAKIFSNPSYLSNSYSFDVVYCSDINKKLRNGFVRRWEIKKHTEQNAAVNKNSVRVPLRIHEIGDEYSKEIKSICAISLIFYALFVIYMCYLASEIIWDWHNTWVRDSAGNWIYEPEYIGIIGPICILIGVIPLVLNSAYDLDDFDGRCTGALLIGGIGVIAWGIIVLMAEQYWPILLTAVVSTLYFAILDQMYPRLLYKILKHET